MIDTGSILRFRVSFEGNEELEGLGVEQALIYRRPSPLWNAALSLELGAASNRFDGDPATGEAGPEADPDESFLRARVTGRMCRRWIQYELAPALNHPWRHEDPWEWSVTLSLRFLYEDYLRSPRAAAPEPFPGADPGPP